MKQPLLLTVFLASAITAVAQAQTTDIKASFKNLVDTRIEGEDKFNQKGMKVTIQFKGYDLEDALGLYKFNVTSASSGLGRNLMLKEENNQHPLWHFEKLKGKPYAEKEIKLKNPRRDASSVSIMGTAEVYTPTKSSVIEVANYLSQSQKPLQQPQIKKHNIEFAYVTQAEQQKVQKEIEEKKKNNPENLGEAFGEAFKQMFGGMMGGWGDPENTIVFNIKDPQEKIVHLEFQTATGEELKTNGRSYGGTRYSVTLNEKPNPTDKLIIHLATDDAIRQVPFNLNEVTLP